MFVYLLRPWIKYIGNIGSGVRNEVRLKIFIAASERRRVEKLNSYVNMYGVFGIIT